MAKRPNGQKAKWPKGQMAKRPKGQKAKRPKRQNAKKAKLYQTSLNADKGCWTMSKLFYTSTYKIFAKGQKVEEASKSLLKIS